jgi:hypothetical protein
MSADGLRAVTLAALCVGLAGCNVNPIPGATTTALNGSWQIANNAPGGRTVQFPSPNFNVNIQPQGNYNVIFFANSPNGVTAVSWSGRGNFYCFNGPWVTPGNPTQGYVGPSGFVGQEPGVWPSESSTGSASQPILALYNPNYVVPCGTGGQNGYASYNGFPHSTPSSQTVTAHATDGSGAKITATLTMTVVQSGGL